MAQRRPDSVPRDPTETEQHYRELLEALARSGLTQRAFARRQRVPAGTLAWWRHELARRDKARASVAGGGEPVLLPVQVVDGGELLPGQHPGARPMGSFEVRLARSGHEVTIPVAFDPGRLALLVRTLEVASC